MSHIKTWQAKSKYVHLALLRKWKLRLMWRQDFFCLEIGPLSIEVSGFPF